ncbi:glycoside hydrolase family 3 N-terminal domain-containing protein [Sediminibacterium soli]|uniref:glycoside hydrolase family 3 N-terminal domain-containing protein n=1 Tax=Sediminibacterium soli TaxID=2698829 RepID=UPI00137943F5|nr:glycoside hydrolase family 3 N-terminal domain-containing protein [Sediminibacterium soli]NCI47617.1 serine hydrolase [Sediminibacterium soli]
MKKTIPCLLLALLAGLFTTAKAQKFYEETPDAKRWVKKKFRKLSKDERIAQLMIIRAHSNLGPEHVAEVTELIKKYNVGGLCFFQGGPVRQALLTNSYQSIAKTPLMISIDAEWGVGMRLDSVTSFPRQLMMGATPDARLIYRFGRAVGEQCRRLGIQVNYAPVVDINNNPLNPVINDRSFGEDKYKVALYGVEYMRGMQDVGIMATAKHFPGHGDVSVDSHKDLPVILKSRGQLEGLELYPFNELIKAGVGSIMTAHLSIPAIDTTTNLPSSLSYRNVTELLRNDLHFKGITFTDALEMQGVAKFFPKGDASVMSLIAGNDMLCLPGDIPGSIQKVKEAIREGKLSWDDINARVKKVLLAKYHLGLNNLQSIQTENLLTDLNAQTDAIRKEISETALTLLNKPDQAVFPIAKGKKIAYVSIGAPAANTISNQLKVDYNADIYLFGTRAQIGAQVMDDKTNIVPADKIDNESAAQVINLIKQKNYDVIVVGLHNFSRRPAGNFGLSNAAVALVNGLQQNNSITVVFGNPYAIKNISAPTALIAAYEDDELTQAAAVKLLEGSIQSKGKLPVSVTDQFRFGTGIVYNSYFAPADPAVAGINASALTRIDSIANDAIEKGAMPGCVVLAARNGKIVYHKAFGYTTPDKSEPVSKDMVYDLASVTKISATTVSIMKLYEQGKVDLTKTLGDYLPWTRGTDKAGLNLTDILLHQAGLNPFIPFYREVIDTSTGEPRWQYFSMVKDAAHQTRVAEDLYLRNDWQDSLFRRILQSKLTPHGRYVYSDNDFIFLGKIVEAVSGKPLNEYVREIFYEPLHMSSTTFRPRELMPLDMIVPTEEEKHFRRQLIRGDVHDEGSAMFGGVAGHAGLFSNAYDLAQLYQMLLNGGQLNGIKLLQQSTIDKFTAYNSDISRRGLGFDKPEKDNATRKEPYPSASASPQTFGHTGFTGTCVWVDPKENLVYIFLSNRVTPTRNNTKFGQMNVRPNIQEAIYHAIIR